MKHLPYASPEVTVLIRMFPDVICTSTGIDPAVQDERWDLLSV